MPFLFLFSKSPSPTEIYTLSYTTLFRSRVARVATGPHAGSACVAHVPDPAALRDHQRLPAACRRRLAAEDPRSEEHTSELQSQSNLVCRLLLEKKKNNITPYDSIETSRQ